MDLAAAALRLDGNGNPRTARLLAALVEAESRYFADAASEPAENDLVRAFRGGATPAVPIAEFLERIQRCNYLYGGAVYVLAGAYLVRFMRSRAARDAGILVEPATAHRLVSVAVLLGAKFSSPRYFERRVEAFQICSGGSIRASEMCGLELLFLRAVDYRIFVGNEEFQRFFRVMERGPRVPSSSSSCASNKRKADREEEPRRVRACQPPVVASSYSKLSSSFPALFRADRFGSFLHCVIDLVLALLNFFLASICCWFLCRSSRTIILTDFSVAVLWISFLFGFLLELLLPVDFHS